MSWEYCPECDYVTPTSFAEDDYEEERPYCQPCRRPRIIKKITIPEDGLYEIKATVGGGHQKTTVRRIDGN